MARPSNVSMSLKHLGDIADDIWYYAGDRSPDVSIANHTQQYLFFTNTFLIR
jgi:ubiquinone biosynthesis protein COQ9